jgi:predicted ester cyclase
MAFLRIFLQIKKVLNSLSITFGKDFHDVRIIFEDLIIEGNKIAGRYYLIGTHKGEFISLQPTNEQFNVNGMTLFAFRNARIIECWNIVDMISLKEQLSS